MTPVTSTFGNPQHGVQKFRLNAVSSRLKAPETAFRQEMQENRCHR